MTGRTLLWLTILTLAQPCRAQFCGAEQGTLPQDVTTISAIGGNQEQLLLVGNNTIYSSTDGRNWVGRFTQSGVNSIYFIKWTELEYIAKAGRTIYTSPNGIDWEEDTPSMDFNMGDAAWDGSQTLLLGTTGPNMLRRPDGGTWETVDCGSTVHLESIAWTGDRFVAVGDSGTILTSTDSSDWEEQVSGTTNGLRSLVTDGMRLMAQPFGNPIYSDDAELWFEGGSPNLSLTALFFASRRFIVGGIDFGQDLAGIATSVDGDTRETLLTDVAESKVKLVAGTDSVTLAMTERRFQTGPANALLQLTECVIFADDFEQANMTQ